MTAKARPPSDDHPGPERVTPGRLADQLLAFAVQVGGLGLKLRRFGAFLPETTIDAPASKLRSLSEYLADLATAVRVGEVSIVAYLDASAIEDAPAPVERAMSGGWRVAPANGGPKPKKKRSGPKAPPIEPGSPAAANDSAAIAAREVEPTSLAEAQATFSEEEEEEEEEGSWRSLPLEKLDLPPGAAQALAHHAIVSVGGLADFLEEGDFRGLATSGLTFAGAAKVRAALDDWWSARGGETPPRWALADSAYDRDHVRGLADWLRRRRAGDDFPRWGKYGEFEVKLWDGQAVAVVYDPAGGRRDGPGAAGAIEFRGPISSTGYTSHSSVEPATVQGRDLVEYCAAFARKKAAEWTALKAKNERMQARAAERRQARAAGGETRKTRAARKPRAAPAADDRAAQRAVETSGPGAPCPEDEEGGDE